MIRRSRAVRVSTGVVPVAQPPKRVTQDTLLDGSVDDVPKSNLGVAIPVLGSPQIAQHRRHRDY